MLQEWIKTKLDVTAARMLREHRDEYVMAATSVSVDRLDEQKKMCNAGGAVAVDLWQAKAKKKKLLLGGKVTEGESLSMLHDRMKNHPDPDVRNRMATDVSTHPDILHHLSFNDPDERVRQNATHTLRMCRGR
jgi:hypothetical protein